MNLPEIRLNIGTHEITLRPYTEQGRALESLEIVTTWHKPATVHHWTMGMLQKWADLAEDDTDYCAAEAAFIFAATGRRACPL